MLISSIQVNPPLLNTSCAWASDFTQLKSLYDCPYTGAVTIRTATLNGFQEDSAHTVKFASGDSISSINSYGYSPHPLSNYLEWAEELLQSTPPTGSPHKPILFSIAASSADELASIITHIQSLRTKMGDRTTSGHARIAVELNTSCPNIAGSPPKGYILDTDATMLTMLDLLAKEVLTDPTLTVGLKLPPYLYKEQFVRVTDLLKRFVNVDIQNPCFSFLTCTNTLGNSLLFAEQIGEQSKDGAGFALPTQLGGLAGDAIHPLAVGNVYSFSQLLREQPDSALSRIVVIGVGGVTSKAAADRMRMAGAGVVGSATLFGKEGVRAFEIITGI